MPKTPLNGSADRISQGAVGAMGKGLHVSGGLFSRKVLKFNASGLTDVDQVCTDKP